MSSTPFVNRWLLTGSITTESEMHVGDGGAGAIHDRSRPATGEDPCDVSTVCVDCRGSAYIPGSAIKGTLRALVSDPETGHIPREWEELFGSDSPDLPGAVGGKLEFWDAFHAAGLGGRGEHFTLSQRHSDTDRSRPWWSFQRKTCVAVSVSLDRRTRTAKENLLYHFEYVPAGERFAFEISGDNLEDDAIARLLALLRRFDANGVGGATLGALASNGWGRVGCVVEEVRCVDAEDLAAWKANPASDFAGCVAVDASRRKILERRSHDEMGVPFPSQDEIRFGICLRMESPWLIQDPRQTERAEAARGAEEADKPSDMAPIRDIAGRPFVPAKSLRGVLRARAEMILRTFDLKCATHPGGVLPVITKNASEDQVWDRIGTEGLSERLFGFPGWRAPLSISRLVPSSDVAEYHQHFVAIDRFSGGASEGAKFDATLAGVTTLKGELVVNLSRLTRVDANLASVGLLALVLRDLVEGDLSIGSGAAKGQGASSARVEMEGPADWRNHPIVQRGLAAFQGMVRK